MKFKSSVVNIIGCGYAGSECALSLADRGVKVHVFDHKKAEANSSTNLNYNDFIYKKPFAKELLREELSILDSNLLKLEKEISCDSERINDKVLIEKAKEKVINHPNIQYFNLNVKEINYDEITIIATGAQTDKDLFNHLIEIFGARKCFDCFPVFPLIKQIDFSKLCKKGENYFLPLSYKQYIDLINLIVLKLNCEIIAKGEKVEQGTIESMVIKEKDCLKNEYLNPVYIDNCEKPYAVVKLEKVGDCFSIDGFASSLSIESQLAIIHSLPGLENAILIQKGQATQNCYINAPYMINQYCQSEKMPNLFFAGNIAGVFGKTESIACGLYVANNIMAYKNDKEFVKLPKDTCIGSMMQKIIKTNNFNYSKFNPIFADYDIIGIDKNIKSVEEMKNFLKERSKRLLEKYKEELKNGKLI